LIIKNVNFKTVNYLLHTVGFGAEISFFYRTIQNELIHPILKIKKQTIVSIIIIKTYFFIKNMHFIDFICHLIGKPPMFDSK